MQASVAEEINRERLECKQQCDNQRQTTEQYTLEKQQELKSLETKLNERKVVKLNVINNRNNFNFLFYSRLILTKRNNWCSDVRRNSNKTLPNVSKQLKCALTIKSKNINKQWTHKQHKKNKFVLNYCLKSSCLLKYY